MRRLKVSNTFFILVLVGILPVYPVFGSVLYNISGGVRNFPIDQTTILSDDYDNEDAAFLSSDIPLDVKREWSHRSEIISYTIQEGDTFSQLSRDFHLTSGTIRWVNNLPTTALRIGQKLIIPPGDGYVYRVITGDTIESISKKYPVTAEAILKANPDITSLLKPGIMVYLPGLTPPIVTQNADSRVSDKITPYTLKLLAPK
jgi:phage tail protein X